MHEWISLHCVVVAFSSPLPNSLRIHAIRASFSAASKLRGILLYIMASSGDMDPEVSEQRIVGLLRTDAPAGTPMVDEVLGIAARESCASPAASQNSPGTARLKSFNLGVPAMYLEFVADALQFARAPNFPCPPSASLTSCSSKRGVWRWVSLHTIGESGRPFSGKCDAGEPAAQGVCQGDATNWTSPFAHIFTPTPAGGISEL